MNWWVCVCVVLYFQCLNVSNKLKMSKCFSFDIWMNAKTINELALDESQLFLYCIYLCFLLSYLPNIHPKLTNMDICCFSSSSFSNFRFLTVGWKPTWTQDFTPGIFWFQSFCFCWLYYKLNIFALETEMHSIPAIRNFPLGVCVGHFSIVFDML